MTVNINEAIAKIKQVGQTNTRIVPMAGQSVLDGKCQIEVREGGSWNAVASGLTQRMAEELVASASNKVILG